MTQGHRVPRSPGALVVLLGCVLTAACTRGTDHERMGDRRYAEHAWVDALAEYRLASRQHRPSVELRAKLATAALRAAALTEAATAWRDLGAADPASRGEASEGLVRTARAAIAARDVSGLRAAIAALHELAPERLPELGGSLALALGDRRVTDPEIALVAAALAGGATSDSLVALWAEVNARAGRCAEASDAFGAVMRRAATPALARSARSQLAACEVEVGRAALAGGLLEQAEAAFRSAVALGMPDSTVRLAWVLIGDTRWAGGDTVIAIEAYRKALAGAEDDNPIAQRAREQLERLTGGNTTTP